MFSYYNSSICCWVSFCHYVFMNNLRTYAPEIHMYFVLHVYFQERTFIIDLKMKQKYHIRYYDNRKKMP